jgi:hypothetical protein
VRGYALTYPILEVPAFTIQAPIYPSVTVSEGGQNAPAAPETEPFIIA